MKKNFTASFILFFAAINLYSSEESKSPTEPVVPTHAIYCAADKFSQDGSESESPTEPVVPTHAIYCADKFCQDYEDEIKFSSRTREEVPLDYFKPEDKPLWDVTSSRRHSLMLQRMVTTRKFLWGMKYSDGSETKFINHDDYPKGSYILEWPSVYGDEATISNIANDKK